MNLLILEQTERVTEQQQCDTCGEMNPRYTA